MIRHCAVNSQHVHVIAQNLEIVGNVIARCESFVVQHGRTLVCRLLQMTSETRRQPCRVAGVTGHALIAVSERRLPCRNSPGFAVGLYGLCQPCFFVVMQIAWPDAIEYLDNLPLLAAVYHRPLEQAVVLPIKTASLPRGSQHR